MSLISPGQGRAVSIRMFISIEYQNYKLFNQKQMNRTNLNIELINLDKSQIMAEIEKSIMLLPDNFRGTCTVHIESTEYGNAEAIRAEVESALQEILSC